MKMTGKAWSEGILVLETLDKPNLRELLTRSLSEYDSSSLKELEGIESFRGAIGIQDKSDRQILGSSI